MVELVLLDYRYVINYTLLFVVARWILSDSGLLTSPILTHSSTYVVYIEGRDRIVHRPGTEGVVAHEREENFKTTEDPAALWS